LPPSHEGKRRDTVACERLDRWDVAERAGVIAAGGMQKQAEWKMVARAVARWVSEQVVDLTPTRVGEEATGHRRSAPGERLRGHSDRARAVQLVEVVLPGKVAVVDQLQDTGHGSTPRRSAQRR
jgi:hypothetical protein